MLTTAAMEQPLDSPRSRPVRPPTASVASWLSVLFVLMLLIVVVGGYVRLSGSGLSIPEWPIVNGSLLPPLSQDAWVEVKAQYEADQQRLRLEVARGALGIGSLGRIPADMPTFQRMFLIEWGHRFVAALVGLVALGCLTVALRHAETRARVGRLLAVILALIVGQAVLGGMLVRSGTATHWLFLHLGTAALILALITWAILRLVDDAAAPDAATRAARRGLRVAAWAAVLVAWGQITLGALVAGSRGDTHGDGGASEFSSEWPTMTGGRWVPDLWVEQRGLAWNLLDNAVLHQWLHRWFALAVLIAIVALAVIAARSPTGPRLRLSLRVVGAFLFAQVVLGLANVTMTHPTIVSLSHLVMGMFLLAGLVLVLYDARREPTAATPPAAHGVPA